MFLLRVNLAMMMRLGAKNLCEQLLNYMSVYV